MRICSLRAGDRLIVLILIGTFLVPFPRTGLTANIDQKAISEATQGLSHFTPLFKAGNNKFAGPAKANAQNIAETLGKVDQGVLTQCQAIATAEAQMTAAKKATPACSYETQLKKRAQDLITLNWSKLHEAIYNIPPAELQKLFNAHVGNPPGNGWGQKEIYAQFNPAPPPLDAPLENFAKSSPAARAMWSMFTHSLKDYDYQHTKFVTDPKKFGSADDRKAIQEFGSNQKWEDFAKKEGRFDNQVDNLKAAYAYLKGMEKSATLPRTDGKKQFNEHNYINSVTPWKYLAQALVPHSDGLPNPNKLGPVLQDLEQTIKRAEEVKGRIQQHISYHFPPNTQTSHGSWSAGWRGDDLKNLTSDRNFKLWSDLRAAATKDPKVAERVIQAFGNPESPQFKGVMDAISEFNDQSVVATRGDEGVLEGHVDDRPASISLHGTRIIAPPTLLLPQKGSLDLAVESLMVDDHKKALYEARLGTRVQYHQAKSKADHEIGERIDQAKRIGQASLTAVGIVGTAFGIAPLALIGNIGGMGMMGYDMIEKIGRGKSLDANDFMMIGLTAVHLGGTLKAIPKVARFCESVAEINAESGAFKFGAKKAGEAFMFALEKGGSLMGVGGAIMQVAGARDPLDATNGLLALLDVYVNSPHFQKGKAACHALKKEGDCVECKVKLSKETLNPDHKKNLIDVHDKVAEQKTGTEPPAEANPSTSGKSHTPASETPLSPAQKLARSIRSGINSMKPDEIRQGLVQLNAEIRNRIATIKELKAKGKGREALAIEQEVEGLRTDTAKARNKLADALYPKLLTGLNAGKVAVGRVKALASRLATLTHEQINKFIQKWKDKFDEGEKRTTACFIKHYGGGVATAWNDDPLLSTILMASNACEKNTN